MSERFKIVSAAYLFLKTGNTILLGKRKNSGFMDGYYSLPAGHIYENESALEAAIREGREEMGISLKKGNLRHALTMHRNSIDRVYMDIFFEVLAYEGDITNNEPHKCQEWKFFPVCSLPGQTVPYVKQAISCLENKVPYVEEGWK